MRLSKRFCLMFLPVMMLAATVVAQPRIAREVHVGAMGGAVLSTYTFSPKVTLDMAKGYTAGIAARYIEEKYFGLQAEFHITRRGIRDHFDEEYPDLMFQRDFTYLELPVLAHIYFNLGEKSEISVDLGPKICYYLSEKTKSHLEGEAWEDLKFYTYHGYQHHEMPVTKKVDYGIQAGLGYEFKINKEISVQIQGRYYFGLANMFPDTKADVFEVSNNHQIQIVAAVWFRQQIAKFLIKKKQKRYSKK